MLTKGVIFVLTTILLGKLFKEVKFPGKKHTREEMDPKTKTTTKGATITVILYGNERGRDGLSIAPHP